VAAQLARSVPIYYSFPLLGMSIFCELDKARATDDTEGGGRLEMAGARGANGLATPGQQRQESGDEGEAAAEPETAGSLQDLDYGDDGDGDEGDGDGDGDGREGDGDGDGDGEDNDDEHQQPPGERRTANGVEDLQVALRNTHMDEFMASLLQGQYSRAALQVLRLMEVCSTASTTVRSCSVACAL
jgi:hypothetical protein